MMATKEGRGAIAHMLERETTLQTVLEQARLSRLKLGSILDRLESLPLDADDLDQLREQAETVAFEVDNLVVLTRTMLER
jgi:hypothetical protein